MLRRNNLCALNDYEIDNKKEIQFIWIDVLVFKFYFPQSGYIVYFIFSTFIWSIIYYHLVTNLLYAAIIKDNDIMCNGV